MGICAIEAEAMEKYSDSVRIDPSNGIAYEEWAHLLFSLGKYGEASSTYEDAIRAGRQTADNYENLGRIRMTLNDEAGAVESFSKALAIDPTRNHLYAIRGDFYYKESEFSLANSDYAKAFFKSEAQVSINMDNWIKALCYLDKYQKAVKVIVYSLLGPRKDDEIFIDELITSIITCSTTRDQISNLLDALKQRDISDTVYLKWGSNYHKLGMNEEAVLLFEKLSQTHHNNAHVLEYWANSLYFIKRYADAQEKFVEANSQGTLSENSSYLHWAETLYTLGRYSEALPKYKKADEIGIHSGGMYCSWGHTLYKVQDYENSIITLTEAIKIDKKLSLAYTYRGFSYYKLRKFNEAIQDCNEAVRLNPRDIAFLCCGLAMSFIGQHDQAVAQFISSIKAGAKSSNLCESLLAELQESGKEGTRCLSLSIKDRSKWGCTYNSIGDAFDTLKNHEEALKYYEKAVETDPENEKAWMDWGFMLCKLGRYKDAESILHKLENMTRPQRDHTDRGCLSRKSEVFKYNIWGFCLYALGDFQEAKAINIDRDSGLGYICSGLVLSDMRNRDTAASQFLKASQRVPRCTLEHVYCGLASTFLGKHEEAVAHFIKAYSSEESLLLNRKESDFFEKVCKRAQRNSMKIEWSDYYTNVGIALYSLDRLEAASDKFRLACELNGENDSAVINRGLIMLKLGRIQEAKQLCGRMNRLCLPIQNNEGRKFGPNLTKSKLSESFVQSCSGDP